jgi:hypothetical protein
MDIRKCKFCGLQLIQKENEGLYGFLKRIYCNKKCAMAGARKDKHWRDGSWPVSTDRKWNKGS